MSLQRKWSWAAREPYSGVTFTSPCPAKTVSSARAHQAGNNYHYHAQPIGLRHQLGDHVDYNATTNRYTESSVAVTNHSPILAWAADGLPVYGPYGYNSPMDAGSGVRRMVSGFALRDGTNGTTAITVPHAGVR